MWLLATSNNNIPRKSLSSACKLTLTGKHVQPHFAHLQGFNGFYTGSPKSKNLYINNKFCHYISAWRFYTFWCSRFGARTQTRFSALTLTHFLSYRITRAKSITISTTFVNCTMLRSRAWTEFSSLWCDTGSYLRPITSLHHHHFQ